MKPEVLFQKYVLCSCAYAAVRKFVHLYDAQIETYAYTPDPWGGQQRQTIKHPMLLGTKIGILGCSVLMSPLQTPFWLLKDINNLDAKFRKRNDLIEKPKDEFDYFFM